MNTFSHVPPGFRFHPTDEELVDYYLRKKIAARKIDLDVIRDVDLYKIEPWDLQELCRLSNDDQNEWYFFSHKDKKYPTGTRTNRATKAGFWKATGRDKAIYLKHILVGMRKTLVFYKGRAPNGQKSDWIMHEYRLETNENGAPQEEGWVVCRVFKKKMTATMKRLGDDSPCWYDHHDGQMSFNMYNDLESPGRIPHHHHPNYNNNSHSSSYQPYPCKQELEHLHNLSAQNTPFLQLPQLESPKMPQQQSSSMAAAAAAANMISSGSILSSYGFDQMPTAAMDPHSLYNGTTGQNNINAGISSNDAQGDDQVTDWRVLDKFVASQLSSHGDDDEDNDQCGGGGNQEAAGCGYNRSVDVATATASCGGMFNMGDENSLNMVMDHQSNNKQEVGSEYGSSSNSGCPIDLWK